MTVYDRRLHAYRPDLADERLRGAVRANAYRKGERAQVRINVTDISREPNFSSGIDTQLLRGDMVTVFDRDDGWAWVQSERDGYVGYTTDSHLIDGEITSTHVVIAPRTMLYPAPDLRTRHLGVVSMGTRIPVRSTFETRGTTYAILETGEAVIEKHIAPLGAAAPDYVNVAERFLHTPYLWGGVSGFGIDCSGLVQLSMFMAGQNVLRDSDMQAASIGEPIELGERYENLQRGDLVFWKGHVAIVTGPDAIIHASGHTMAVSHEGLREAVDRIGYLYGGPTGFRRP